jgi:hypothetical protein
MDTDLKNKRDEIYSIMVVSTNGRMTRENL